MKNEYEFEPYKKIGRFAFVAPRGEIIKALGEPLSSQMDGYPIADSYLKTVDLTPRKNSAAARSFFSTTL